MNFRQLILLSLAIGGAPPSHAAIILDRSGDITAQCCQFAALAINWTMDREWTNVKIELDLHNDADEGEVHTGVALLLNSLGPGTTEAANEIDDVVVAEGGVDQKAVTLFRGLTLGPGTYHLVYYRLSYDFPLLPFRRLGRFARWPGDRAWGHRPPDSDRGCPSRLSARVHVESFW